MTESTEHALQTLDYYTVLDLISGNSSTVYGIRRVMELVPVSPGAQTDKTFDRIECLVNAIQREESLPFDGVCDLDDAIEKAAVPGTYLDCRSLLDIARTIQAVRRLKSFMEKRREAFKPLIPLADLLIPLPHLVEAIETKIDPKTEELRDSASRNLQRLRKEITSNERRTRSRLEILIKRFSGANLLQDTTFSLRDSRYVLAVRASSRGKVHGIVHGVSSSGETVFIEPDELVELGNEARRLAEELSEEIRRILLELTAQVSTCLPDIKSTLDGTGHLDSLQARAYFARKNGALRPRFSRDELELAEVRHPLLMMRKGLKDTVPLNLKLDRGENVLVITGPNAGGKTVALKTLGLVTALAHAGVMPPCGDGTNIPEIDSWHVVIGDDQSLEGDLSSFSGHITRLKEILDDKSVNKLVLVDEIASGTDPAEGGAIAMSLLEHAVSKGWWTTVTTHIGALKAFAHRTSGVKNGSMQFDRDHLSPTYRFMPDLPGSSYALEIAARVGLPDNLLERAGDLIGDERQRLEDLIEELSERLGETEEQKRELDVRQNRTADMEKLLRERIDELQQERARLAGDISRQAEQVLQEANRAVEKAVKLIREKQASREAIRQAHHIVDRQKESVKSIRREMLGGAKKKSGTDITEPVGKESEPDKTVCGPVQPGDEVILKNGEKARVLALKKDRVQVAVGMIKLWLPTTEVRKTAKAKDEKAPAGKVHLHLDGEEETGPAPLELKLLGMRYEEAEAVLLKYIGDISLSGLSRARIVHGKGTGALRSMVQEVASRHPNVLSFRYGEPDEGGFGVTIIELKD